MKIKPLLILAAACACLLLGCSRPPDTKNALSPSVMVNDELYYYTGKEAAAEIKLTELPKKYPPDEAIANGDYVNVHGQISNEDKLTEFISAVNSKDSAAIRMVQYTVEGDPIISDIIFDGNRFTVFNDTTRDAFGKQKISKNEYERMLEYNRGGVIYVFLTNEDAITDERYDNRIDGYLLYYAPAKSE